MLTVKKNVTEMEHLVEQAETDLGSVSTVKKVLNSVPSLFTPVTFACFLALKRSRSSSQLFFAQCFELCFHSDVCWHSK